MIQRLLIYTAVMVASFTLVPSLAIAEKNQNLCNLLMNHTPLIEGMELNDIQIIYGFDRHVLYLVNNRTHQLLSETPYSRWLRYDAKLLLIENELYLESKIENLTERVVTSTVVLNKIENL